jgi:DNA-binding transcriptional LysR family regulator
MRTAFASDLDVTATNHQSPSVFGKRIARDMIAVRISDEIRHVVVESPDYLVRHPHPQTPQDLLSHNCIRMRFPSGAFLPWQFAVKGQIVELEVNGSVIVNEPELLVRAAIDGIGLLYMIEDYVAPMICAGKLISVLDKWMPPPADASFLYYPSRQQNPAPLRALIDFLRTNLKTNARSRKEKAQESMAAS